jgi:hypothetical protein
MIKKYFRFSTLRMQLVGSVFLLITPAWLVMYIFDLPMSGFVVGVLALAASWFGGEHFILHEVRALSSVAQRIAEQPVGLSAGFFCWDLNGNGVGASEKHGYSFRPH